MLINDEMVLNVRNDDFYTNKGRLGFYGFSSLVKLDDIQCVQKGCTNSQEK